MCSYVYVTLTGQANLRDNLQDKVDTLQDKVVDLQDKLDTFQNTTEASARKNHHEVVELLQNNTSSSLDGKILPYSQAPSHKLNWSQLLHQKLNYSHG